MSHHRSLGLGIGLGVTVNPHFIGQEQPTGTPRPYPRARVVKRQPARTALQVRSPFWYTSLGQLLGKLVCHLTMQDRIAG